MNSSKIKLGLLFFLFILAMGFHAKPAQADPITCEGVNVPISIPGVPAADHVYGELCMPANHLPATVQFLVHSTWSNHREWDPPQQKYSHVRKANLAGYATFAIDRFGTGRSSKPPSSQVTTDTMAIALHQVIQALRNGNVGSSGDAFTKVVWIGSSFGSEYGWINASKYPGDVDAFVLNGLLHFTRESFTNDALGWRSHSICDDPELNDDGSDCGYVTNKLGCKGQLDYCIPFAAPGMLPAIDDLVLRDMVSATLLSQSVLYVGVTPELPTTPFPVDPSTSPSQAIHVPTLINLGDHDQIVCGPPDGVPCTHDFIAAFETPYFGVTPDVYIAPNTGHALTLHQSGPETSAVINNWIDIHVGAN